MSGFDTSFSTLGGAQLYLALIFTSAMLLLCLLPNTDDLRGWDRGVK